MQSQDKGIFIGFEIDERGNATQHPRRFTGTTHLITIGPTGCGKGTGLIFPNLSELQRSIVIIDPKGEAAAVSARKRKNYGDVVILNPFGELTDIRKDLASTGFNPLLGIKSSDDLFADNVMNIAEALVRIEGSEPHWSASAQDLVAALIMWEIIEAERENRAPSLAKVRDTLTSANQGTDKDGATAGFYHTAALMSRCKHEAVRNKAGRFTRPTNEISSVISVACTQTRFLDSHHIRADLSKNSSFKFADMKQKIITTYVILPARRLSTHSNWLRLIIASALDNLMTTPGEYIVLFMLDEFAQLGHLTRIADALSFARGFKVQLWPFLQDINQLKKIYGQFEYETFIGQRGALTVFAPRDMTTAKYFSEMAGQTTVEIENYSESRDMHGEKKGESISVNSQGLPVILPQELMRMKERQMLCFDVSRKYPFYSDARLYKKTKYFSEGLDPNPYD